MAVPLCDHAAPPLPPSQGISTEKDTVDIVKAFAGQAKTIMVLLDSEHSSDHVAVRGRGRVCEPYHAGRSRCGRPGKVSTLALVVSISETNCFGGLDPEPWCPACLLACLPVQLEAAAFCPLVTIGSYCIVEDTKMSRWSSSGPLPAVKVCVCVRVRTCVGGWGVGWGGGAHDATKSLIPTPPIKVCVRVCM